MILKKGLIKVYYLRNSELLKIVFGGFGMMGLTKKDFILLNFLRRNARENLTTMSRLTNIPVSTLYDRLKAREQDVIRKHTTIVDFDKIGFSSRTQIALRFDRSDRDAAKAYLMNNHQVNSLYKINNGYDFLIDAIFKNVKELDEFLDKLEVKFKLQDKMLFYVIEDIKREEFLSDPKLFNFDQYMDEALSSVTEIPVFYPPAAE